MDKKIVKLPVSSWQRHKNKMGPGYVPCMTSERWLQFPKESVGHFGGGEFIEIEVMTNGTDDKPKKLCNMIITREELTSALNAVKPPEE
jgi:hypothetical protein